MRRSTNGGFQQAIPTVTQIGNYLSSTGGHANSNGLYLISSGGNDVSFALGQTGTGPFPANPTAYLLNAANGLAGAVAQLQAAGARYILVPDLPFSFPTNNATERQARLDYSLALWSALATDGVNFIPADWNAVRVAIAANPSAFGFQFIGTGPAQVACVKNPANPLSVNSASALLCSSDPNAPYILVTPDADRTHLFADEQHIMSRHGILNGKIHQQVICLGRDAETSGTDGGGGHGGSVGLVDLESATMMMPRRPRKPQDKGAKFCYREGSLSLSNRRKRRAEK